MCELIDSPVVQRRVLSKLLLLLLFACIAAVGWLFIQLSVCAQLSTQPPRPARRCANVCPLQIVYVTHEHIRLDVGASLCVRLNSVCLYVCVCDHLLSAAIAATTVARCSPLLSALSPCRFHFDLRRHLAASCKGKLTSNDCRTTRLSDLATNLGDPKETKDQPTDRPIDRADRECRCYFRCFCASSTFCSL